jgi:GxxExxY protein
MRIWRILLIMSSRQPLLHEAVTGSIIGAFYELYNELGYGFFESVYANGMEQLLKDRGHTIHREVIMKVYLYGKVIGTYKADKIVDGVVVLEHKAGRKLPVVPTNRCSTRSAALTSRLLSSSTSAPKQSSTGWSHLTLRRTDPHNPPKSAQSLHPCCAELELKTKAAPAQDGLQSIKSISTDRSARAPQASRSSPASPSPEPLPTLREAHPSGYPPSRCAGNR